jgi:hypothetical protein
MKIFSPALLPAIVLAATTPVFADIRLEKPADTAPAVEAPHSIEADFIRFEEATDGTGKLQTATTSYRNEKGQIVDLMGVVHVGDSAYYQRLDEQLAGYDTVLYELVGGPMPKNGQRGEAMTGEMETVRSLQKVLFRMIGLSSQLEGINYQRDNFVHADVSWDEWKQLQAERQESMLSLLLRAMEAEKNPEVKQLMGDSSAALTDLMGMLSDFEPQKFKMLLAPMLGEAEAMLKVMEGEDGSAILSDRNEVALGVMNAELAKGAERTCVFYGAGHMPGMDAALLDQGFQKIGTRWETAWEIGIPDPNRERVGILTHLMQDPDVMKSLISGFGKAFSGMAVPKEAPPLEE